MAAKDELRRIIDEIPEDIPPSELLAAKRFLEYLLQRWTDPVLRSLENAPYEDEPISSEEEAAVREAREAYSRGEVVTDDELKTELDI